MAQLSDLEAAGVCVLPGTGQELAELSMAQRASIMIEGMMPEQFEFYHKRGERKENARAIAALKTTAETEKAVVYAWIGEREPGEKTVPKHVERAFRRLVSTIADWARRLDVQLLQDSASRDRDLRSVHAWSKTQILIFMILDTLAHPGGTDQTESWELKARDSVISVTTLKAMVAGVVVDMPRVGDMLTTEYSTPPLQAGAATHALAAATTDIARLDKITQTVSTNAVAFEKVCCGYVDISGVTQSRWRELLEERLEMPDAL